MTVDGSDFTQLLEVLPGVPPCQWLPAGPGREAAGPSRWLAARPYPDPGQEPASTGARAQQQGRHPQGNPRLVPTRVSRAVCDGVGGHGSAAQARRSGTDGTAWPFGQRPLD